MSQTTTAMNPSLHTFLSREITRLLLNIPACQSVRLFATDDETAEKAGESSRKAAQLSDGVSLTWQGT